MTKHLKQSLLLAAFAHLALELSNNYLPIVYPLLIDEIGLTFTQIGIITFVAGFGGSLLQPVFGYFSDRWGPVGLTALSVAWTGLVMGLVGWTRNYWLLMLLAGLGGLGSAAFHPPGAVIASSSSEGRRRGASLSVFSVGGNIGAAASPLLVGLALAWIGLKGTAVLIPVALLSGLVLLVGLRRSYQPQASFRAQPDRSMDQPSASRATQLARTGSTLGLTLLILVVMARSWFEMSIKSYLPVWLEGEGWSLEAASQLFFFLLAAVGIGSLAGGALSDRIGRWQVMGLSMVLLTVAFWLFMGGPVGAQLVMVALMGMAVGSTFPVSIAIAHEMWPARTGMASALVMGLGWLPGGIGAAVTGHIADQVSLAAGLWALLLAPVFGMVCVLAYVILQRHIRRALALEVEAA